MARNLIVLSFNPDDLSIYDLPEFKKWVGNTVKKRCYFQHKKKIGNKDDLIILALNIEKTLYAGGVAKLVSIEKSGNTKFKYRYNIDRLETYSNLPKKEVRIVNLAGPFMYLLPNGYLK
ncbi:MAG: hypothetical protein ACYCQJ_05615 [Nitrososphaerales archaeon]